MNKKISELDSTQLANMTFADLLVIVNEGLTKKVTLENLQSKILSGIVNLSLNDNFILNNGGFEFFSGIEPVFKAKTGQDIYLTGFRYYDAPNDTLHTIGLMDTTNLSGGKNINYAITNFTTGFNYVVQVADGTVQTLIRNMSNNEQCSVRLESEEIAMFFYDTSISPFLGLSIHKTEGFEFLGCPEFTDDAAAGVAGLSSGKMYFNTTVNAYTKKS